jgi:hypothetical protein
VSSALAFRKYLVHGGIMENLERYAAQFDAEYPDYADVRYAEIAKMVNRYDSTDAEILIASASFKKCVAIIQPMIAIKNYKTQVPFPEDLLSALEAVVALRKADVDTSDQFKNLDPLFNKLERIQGFQLPTISAIFHFLHPNSFPIVDKNVQAACKILICQNQELINLECPTIPAPRATATTKFEKYRHFVQIIDRIKEVHPEGPLKNSYRNMDKALMVLGSLKLKKQKNKKTKNKNKK